MYLYLHLHNLVTIRRLCDTTRGKTCTLFRVKFMLREERWSQATFLRRVINEIHLLKHFVAKNLKIMSKLTRPHPPTRLSSIVRYKEAVLQGTKHLVPLVKQSQNSLLKSKITQQNFSMFLVFCYLQRNRFLLCHFLSFWLLHSGVLVKLSIKYFFHLCRVLLRPETDWGFSYI